MDDAGIVDGNVEAAIMRNGGGYEFFGERFVSDIAGQSRNLRAQRPCRGGGFLQPALQNVSEHEPRAGRSEPLRSQPAEPPAAPEIKTLAPSYKRPLMGFPTSRMQALSCLLSGASPG